MSELLALPTESVETCANCQSSASRTDARFARWLKLERPYAVRVCSQCALRWLSPRPTALGYKSVYSTQHYFGEHAGEGISYEGVLNARNAQFSKRLMELAKRFPGRESLNILDYGAATGEFVAAGQALGHRCVGVELSQDARETAYSKFGITLYTPEDLPEFPEGFDVIHMNHVFEHMPDPVAHLAWCHRQLVDGGMLLIEVPQQFCNHIDGLKRLLGRGGKFDKFSAFSLHHTYFYTANSLLEIIGRNGFQPIEITTYVTGPRLGIRHTFRSLLMDVVLRMANAAGRGGDNIELIASKFSVE